MSLVYGLAVLPFQPFTFPMVAGIGWSLALVVHQTDHQLVHQMSTGYARGYVSRVSLDLESANCFKHHLGMDLTLPQSLESRLSPKSTALHLAIGLYVAAETTLGQSAEVAQISQAEFLRELGNRRIPIHYGAEELAEDLKSVESMSEG